MTDSHIPLRAWIDLFLLALLWGGSFLAIRTALDEIGFLSSVTHRVLWAALILWAVDLEAHHAWNCTTTSSRTPSEQTGNARFALDAYRRLINMFGDVVMGVEHHLFEKEFDLAKKRHGVVEEMK